MAGSEDDTEGAPDEPISPEALGEFLDGLEEEFGPDFGVISSQAEKQEALREIAREMGLEEEYVPMVKSAASDDEEAFFARMKVRGRYDELLSQGKIREDPDWDDPFEEFMEELDRHYSGEEPIAELDNDQW